MMSKVQWFSFMVLTCLTSFRGVGSLLHVAVFGGSFTIGIGTECEQQNLPSAHCAWPHFLEAMLQSQGLQVRIDNRAVAGSSIPGLFPMLIAPLLADHSKDPYDLIIINYSANHNALLMGTKKRPKLPKKPGASKPTLSISKEQEVVCGTEAFIRSVACLAGTPQIVFIEDGGRLVWPHDVLGQVYGIQVFHSQAFRSINPHVNSSMHMLLAEEIAQHWQEVSTDKERKPFVDDAVTTLRLSSCPKLGENSIRLNSEVAPNWCGKNNISGNQQDTLSSGCCDLRILSERFRHCPVPLFSQYGTELTFSTPHTGHWKVVEDVKGKPGLIIDILEQHISDGVVVSGGDTALSSLASDREVVLQVPISKDGVITFTYLKSYESYMGKVLVWLDTISPKGAKHVLFIDSQWNHNVSLSQSISWLPNRPFIKNIGYRYFDYYQGGSHDLHIRLVTTVDSSLKHEGKVLTNGNSQRKKFKLLGLSSC